MNESFEVKAYNHFFMHGDHTNRLDSCSPYEDVSSSYKKIITNFQLSPTDKNELRKFIYKIENIAPSQSAFQIYILKDDLGYIADIVIDSLHTNFKIYLISEELIELFDEAKREIEAQINAWKNIRFVGKYA